MILLATLGALGSGESPAPDFDPLFDPLAGASRCGPPSTALRLALAGKPETSPFRPVPAQAAPGPVQRYKDLGRMHFPLGPKVSAEAQAWFDQGLRLAFAFNHAEAQRAFQQAQRAQPDCALCHWGEAWVLGPNINAPMAPEAHAPAITALLRAESLEKGLSPLHRGLIDALMKRHSSDAKDERAPLDAAFADAMQALADRFPRDDLVQLIAAEAAMDTQPWDYWEAGGVKPKGRGAQILKALETVLKRSPDNAGAIHLYIHAVEASTTPERALAGARRLAGLVPGAGHLVHMPAHIYYRVGLYRDSLRANQQAILVDEAYFKNSPSDPMYRSAYYPHNIHFLMVSAQLGGDGDTALKAAAKLDAAVSEAVVDEIPALQPIKAAPYTVHALFSAPEQLLTLPAPAASQVLVRVHWHYARVLANARLGRFDAARSELNAIEAIEQKADFKVFEAWGVPALTIVQTARQVASARLAEAQGQLEDAGRAYEAAIALEDSLAYTEPPYWYYPIRQSLGGLRLKQGRLDEAERALRDSLARTRNNGWALGALLEVYRQKGDASAERSTRAALQRAWFGPKEGPDLTRL